MSPALEMVGDETPDELLWLTIAGVVSERDAAREELAQRIAEAAEEARWRRAS